MTIDIQIKIIFLDLRNLAKNVNTEHSHGSTVKWSDNDEEVWSIVLIGVTGAGKSYFANTLLGSTTPDKAATSVKFDPNSENAATETCFFAQENAESVTSQGMLNFQQTKN